MGKTSQIQGSGNTKYISIHINRANTNKSYRYAFIGLIEFIKPRLTVLLAHGCSSGVINWELLGFTKCVDFPMGKPQSSGTKKRDCFMYIYIYIYIYMHMIIDRIKTYRHTKYTYKYIGIDRHIYIYIYTVHIYMIFDQI